MKRKRVQKPPTKQERQMMKQIQAMPPMDENKQRAVLDKVVGGVL
ncbi:hypothetical protein [Spirosoma fluminis]